MIFQVRIIYTVSNNSSIVYSILTLNYEFNIFHQIFTSGEVRGLFQRGKYGVDFFLIRLPSESDPFISKLFWWKFNKYYIMNQSNGEIMSKF